MKPWIVKALLVSMMGLFVTSACRSQDRNAPWRNASVLVLGVDTDHVETIEGEDLRAYLRGFELDDRSQYRPATGTRFGYILINGLRHRVTVSMEDVGNGRTLLTIHSGADPLHLRQKGR